MHTLQSSLKGYKTRHVAPLFGCLDFESQRLVIEDAVRYPSFGTSDVSTVDAVGHLRSLLYVDTVYRALFYYRCSQCRELGSAGKVLLYLCKRDLPASPSVELHAKSIGGGFRLYHGSVVIGQTTIGRNVSVNAGVVVGKKNGLTPIIHDDVQIGANAVVIGQIDVGEGSFVGAGAVVLHDVPAGTVVAGNPAVVIHGH